METEAYAQPQVKERSGAPAEVWKEVRDGWFKEMDTFVTWSSG